MQSYISPVIGWVLFGLALTVFLMTLVLVLEGGALVALDNRVQDALKPVRTSDVVKTANVFTQLGGRYGRYRNYVGVRHVPDLASRDSPGNHIADRGIWFGCGYSCVKAHGEQTATTCAGRFF